MKALLQIGEVPAWEQSPSTVPWPLLPVGNRPLLEYWFELCLDLGISDVWIILSDFASEVEAYASGGEQWGLNVHYGFERAGAAPLAYLKRSPDRWKSGLLHLRGPLFPSRTEQYSVEHFSIDSSGLLFDSNDARLMIARTPEMVAKYLEGASLEQKPQAAGLSPEAILSIDSYFTLNQRFVKTESRRYLTPGYQATPDNSFIGANTVIPPTAKLIPPIIIGDNCRIGDLTTVGPCAILGNHVVVDHNTELDHCLVMEGSYIGRNMEIKKKVISGSHLYDVEMGIGLDLPDPWLLSSSRRSSQLVDRLRLFTHFILALPAVILMVLPYLLLTPFVTKKTDKKQQKVKGRGDAMLTIHQRGLKKKSGFGKIYYAFALDRFPYFCAVLCGKLWLCGHRVGLLEDDPFMVKELPVIFPAAISYEDLQPERSHSKAALLGNAFYYLKVRSPIEDFRVFFRFLFHRLAFLWVK